MTREWTYKTVLVKPETKREVERSKRRLEIHLDESISFDEYIVRCVSLMDAGLE